MQPGHPSSENRPLPPHENGATYPKGDPSSQQPPGASAGPETSRSNGLSEDLWATILGLVIFAASLSATAIAGEQLTGLFGQPGGWSDSPLESLNGKGKVPAWVSSFAAVAAIAILGIPAIASTNRLEKSGPKPRLIQAFLMIAFLAMAAFMMAGQSVVKGAGFEYVFWALLLGLLISNTVGTPNWLRGAVRGELFIKWGLVLLGAEVLLGKLLALGLPGVLVSWVVTPIVLISTFILGVHVLKIPSPSLVMVVAADMSVCGVSAAIATAAACRAKKEELSMAISLSLAFTAVMMVLMPAAFNYAGVDDVVGGAWIGGTIDSTGAVAAAGAALGDRGLKVATTVKMIQNVLIGAIAFAVSIYWAATYESDSDSIPTSERLPRKAIANTLLQEIWRRFPKFVLGFLALSLIASLIAWSSVGGEAIVNDTINNLTKHLRNWLFCLAFVCIGLETNIRNLLPALSGGKAVLLYLLGQTLNIVLTGIAAFLVFGWLFRDYVQELLK